jgi:hypothetical protein
MLSISSAVGSVISTHFTLSQTIFSLVAILIDLLSSPQWLNNNQKMRLIYPNKI